MFLNLGKNSLAGRIVSILLVLFEYYFQEPRGGEHSNLHINEEEEKTGILY